MPTAHACPNCGTTTTGHGRCTTCARPDNQRKNQRATRTVYATTRWRRLRPRILKRDNHTCQLCGQPGNTIGHIQPFRDATDPLAWATTNLRTECSRCSGREAGQRWQAQQRP